MPEAENAHWPTPLDDEWRMVHARGGKVARVSPLASVRLWVSLGEGVVIHPFALVGHLPSRMPTLAHLGDPQRWLHIGERTEVGPHTTLYGGLHVGDDTLIGDGASIRENVRIGNRCIIGRNVTINFGVVIGDDTRIMDGSFIAENTRIGEGCLLGAGVVTSGDRHPNIRDYKYAGSYAPVIEDSVLVGSGANILPGVRIGIGAVVAAGAVVAESVPPRYRAIGPKASVVWVEAPKDKAPVHHPV